MLSSKSLLPSISQIEMGDFWMYICNSCSLFRFLKFMFPFFYTPFFACPHCCAITRTWLLKTLVIDSFGWKFAFYQNVEHISIVWTVKFVLEWQCNYTFFSWMVTCLMLCHSYVSFVGPNVFQEVHTKVKFQTLNPVWNPLKVSHVLSPYI